MQPAAVLAGRAPVVRSKMLQGSTPPDDFAKQKRLSFSFSFFFYVLYSVTVLKPSTKDASRQREISRAAAEMSGVSCALPRTSGWVLGLTITMDGRERRKGRFVS